MTDAAGTATDSELVAAMRDQDPAGLTGVYQRYADRLYAYACWVLHDRDAAADALQESFLIAAQRIDQLRDPERLRPWLYAVVRHECLRHLRARRRTVELEEAGEVRDETVDLDAGLRADATGSWSGPRSRD
jgi:RNA polymerase sigma factor (sigma-70 family)